MNINSPIDGIRNAQNSFDKSASNISNSMQFSNNIEDDIANLKVSKTSFSANIRVAKTENEMLGELIDLIG